MASMGLKAMRLAANLRTVLMTGTGAGVSHVLAWDGYRLTASAKIKENDGSISRHGPNDGRLNLIEADVGDGVRVVWPLYPLRGRAVFQIPDADAASARRRGKAVARPVE
jgi:hypothetical protein